MAERAPGLTDSCEPYLQSLVELLAEVEGGTIKRMGSALAEVGRRQGAIWVLGNGGSASNASHLVLHLRRANLAAHNLVGEVPAFSAYSNDYSYSAATMRQLRNMGRDRDALIVFSGSGDSSNVLTALAEARRIGMPTLGILGFGGGAAKGLCDCALTLSSRAYGPLEDAHSAILHILSAEVQHLTRAPGCGKQGTTE